MSRTTGSLICRETGHPRAIQPLLGHTKVGQHGAFLGAELANALAIAESIDL